MAIPGNLLPSKLFFMATHLFEENDIHSPFSTIHRFFEIYGLNKALQYIESSLLAATDKKIWKGKAPGELLHFTDNLEALREAVFTLDSADVKSPDAKIGKPGDAIPDISATQHYLNSYYHSNAWNNFPRSLTAAQYHDPYKAISKFCNYMSAGDWTKFIKELLDYALSNDTIYGGDHGYNILKIRRCLMLMVEASHLIDVRTHKKTVPGESR